MWVYRGIRLIPVHVVPMRDWLKMPLVESIPVVDDAGIPFTQDLALTQGFYAAVAAYLAWQVFLYLYQNRPTHEE